MSRRSFDFEGDKIEREVVQRGRPRPSFRDSGRRIGLKAAWFLRVHPAGSVAFVILVAVSLLVVFADFVTPFEYDRTVAARLLGPLSEARDGHRLWLGSDELGRDMVTRVLHGGRTSLAVGLLAPLFGVGVGTVLGISSAHFGGLVDLLVQRLVDTILVLPGLIVAIVVTVSFGFTMPVVILALAVNFLGVATRVVRSRALTLTQMQYVEAARAIGASDRRIIFRHLVPNSMAVAIVLLAVNAGLAITAEAALSFLGFGIQPPTPSWGNMLSSSQFYFDLAPHIAVIPGVAITIVVLAINMWGDTLRDVLDPRLRGVG